jgi:hypothetical protein
MVLPKGDRVHAWFRIGVREFVGFVGVGGHMGGLSGAIAIFYLLGSPVRNSDADPDRPADS